LLFQYFGYDPNTYIDQETDMDKSNGNLAASRAAPIPSSGVSTQISVENRDSVAASFDQPPPRLPRPLSKLNCVQSRTTLARLLRYQQAGNNPVYGSPETRPPW
jgi:hypothetical protein